MGATTRPGTFFKESLFCEPDEPVGSLPLSEDRNKGSLKPLMWFIKRSPNFIVKFAVSVSDDCEVEIIRSCWTGTIHLTSNTMTLTHSNCSGVPCWFAVKWVFISQFRGDFATRGFVELTLGIDPVFLMGTLY